MQITDYYANLLKCLVNATLLGLFQPLQLTDYDVKLRTLVWKNGLEYGKKIYYGMEKFQYRYGMWKNHLPFHGMP